MTKKTFTALLALSVLFSACSTSVQVLSDPPGAEVEINGQIHGKTPLTLQLSDFAFSEYQVRLKKDGYREKNEKLQKEVKGGTLVGGIFLWPFLLWCYGPTPVQNYKLEQQ